MVVLYRFVLLLMSFATLLRGEPAPKQAPNRQYRNQKSSIDQWIYQGQNVKEYMQEQYGHERAVEMLHSIAQRANESQQSVSGGSQPSGAADPHNAEADDEADDGADGGATRKNRVSPMRFGVATLKMSWV